MKKTDTIVGFKVLVVGYEAELAALVRFIALKRAKLCFRAPPLVGISNQFEEDLKRIYLKTFWTWNED